MANILIKNIGAIKEAKFDLNKINVFIGPNSSGKSTIAKIISYCSWVEKNTVLTSKSSNEFYKDLISFHNIDSSYFNDKSEIYYKTDCCEIKFLGKTKEADIKIKIGINNVFRNRKIEYIPSERNFVSSISGLGKYNESDNNVQNFLFDWYKAKLDYNKENAFPMPFNSFDGSYFYTKDSDADNIKLKDGTIVSLQHSSSGLQSITPLMIVLDYVCNRIYDQKRTLSPLELIHLEEKLKILNQDQKSFFDNLLLQMKNLSLEAQQRPEKKGEEIGELISEAEESVANLLGIFSNYHYSQIIIEEPEQNLFPRTQNELIYHLIKLINNQKHDHQLIITTHSPFVLYALNNCMIGSSVENKLPKKVKDSILYTSSFIDPQKVSVFKIEGGKLSSIQDESGIIGKNYFDDEMKAIMDDFYNMINYYSHDKK